MTNRVPYFEHCLRQVGHALANPELASRTMYSLGNNAGKTCTFLEYFRQEALSELD